MFKFHSKLNGLRSHKIIQRIKRFNKCKNDKNSGQEKLPNFEISEVERFVNDCAVKVGCSEKNALALSKLLIQADCMGVKTHGLNRLEMYLSEVENGVTDGKAKPEITKETEVVALINGNNGLGHIIAAYAMEVAILKAKCHGAGLVVCHNGNHYGVAGVYTLQAMENGYIGITFTNTSPLVTPWGAKSCALGTNPFSIGGPAMNSDHFNIDISSSAVAVGKVEIKMKTNQPLPPGWAINPDGTHATDAAAVIKDTRLLPLGSPNFGHLGFGLGLMTDMVSGILGGAKFGPFIKKFRDPSRKSDLGYTFIAIDPEKFAGNFRERFSALLKDIRSMCPIDENKPVLVGGDIEKKAYENTFKTGLLDYNPTQLGICEKMAKRLNVTPLRPAKT